MPDTTPDAPGDGAATASAGPAAGADLAVGLPMFTAADPDALAAERAELVELNAKPTLARWGGFFSKTGPGWLQSAMTLGGGSAAASLFLGATFGYKMLWLQPIAMILGIIMLSAMSHQTLSTGARPFDAMKRHVTPAIAWAWAIATLASTVIWHFPQYGLAAGMTEDMVSAATGWAPAGAMRVVFLLVIGLIVLGVSTAIVWNYAGGRRGIRLYEKLLKVLVWGIVIAFGAVVIGGTIKGKVAWGEVFKGFLPLHLPTDPVGVTKLMAAFGAAIGINMTFLFPYTLLARGWGKEHRGLSRFDLVTGMFLPYTIATSLMIIAAAATIHGSVEHGTKVSTVAAAGMLEAAGLGKFTARYVFGLGILGMALSTITMHMLVSGFAFCEIFGIEPGGKKYKLACLFPAVGVLGVVLWPYMGFWIAMPTSAICGLMLPIAYIGTFILNNKKGFLGRDTPTGGRAWAWNIGMGLAVLAALASSAYYLYTKVAAWLA
ncbi:MAG: divalent metal cation transporter [Planctomycetota bacterium]|jgi:Mn2+/Fe2+ NRAMP family transporter